MNKEFSRIQKEITEEQKELFDEISRILKDYNIKIEIKSKNRDQKILKFNDASGNLGKGLLVLNEVMMNKLGVDLKQFFEIDDMRDRYDRK